LGVGITKLESITSKASQEISQYNISTTSKVRKDVNSRITQEETKEVA